MNRKFAFHPVFRARATPPILTFILLIVTVFSAACNIPFNQPESAQEFSDKNARMYQMYFDSSPDPALNELQIRRFMGQLHMADIADIFGDVQSLPLDQNCNYAAGPVEHDGATWFLTATPDLVGVNLISITPDGTRSSVFDLDGDRVVDILDLRLFDNRRISIFTEEMGMDVFRNYLEGLDPFCNPELIRQLGLPELGCNERGGGPSAGGGAVGRNDLTDAGLYDPIAALCAEYDTGPRADFMNSNPNRGYRSRESSASVYDVGDYERSVQQTTTEYDDGEVWIETTIVDYDANGQVVRITSELVTPSGAVRQTWTKDPAGHYSGPVTVQFTVAEKDRGERNYDPEATNPPPDGSGQVTQEGDGDERTTTEQGTASEGATDSGAATRSNPGPEGDDTAIAAFCRERANHRSGIEQAVSQDPAAINLSCGDLVGAPSGGNCSIIQWAGPADFTGVLEPPEGDEGCDEFDNSQGSCEGASVEDRIRQFLGHGASLWSLDLPAIDICPDIVCNPGMAVEVQSYTAGGINITCPVAADASTPTLEPSEENCPPGTYYAPVTDRCIAIQIPEGGSRDGGGEGGGCNLSSAACSNQGLSFDSNSCQCVPIQ